MRRLLRDVADDRPLGDVTTLLDPSVVNSIKDHMSEGGGEDKE
jgi:acetyl-CoA synthetase